MKRNVERMRYKNDVHASGLCLLAIAFDVVYFIAVYSSSTIVPDYPIGIDVIVNILFMLVAFWASEQAKVYDLRWAYGIAVLGVVQIGRMFWLPEMYHNLEQFTGTPYLVSRYSLLASAACLFAAALICYINSTALRKYYAAIKSIKN